MIVNRNTILCSGVESSTLSTDRQSRGISGLEADERIYSQIGLSVYEKAPLERGVLQENSLNLTEV